MCECQQNLFCTSDKKEGFEEKHTFIGSINDSPSDLGSRKVLVRWGPLEGVSPGVHATFLSESSSALRCFSRQPLVLHHYMTVETLELGNLVYDSLAFSVSEYFIKSCHYWLGSLSPQTGRTHGSSRVIFYLGQKQVFVLQLFIVRMAPFGKLTLPQGPLCIYYTKVVFWAQKCTPPHPHKPVCPPPLSAYCSPGSPVRLHTVTRSSV